MVQFDWTISLGTVLHGIVVLGGLFMVYVKMEHRLTSMETKINAMWHWWMKRLNGHDE